MKILVVDDDVLNRRGVCDYLVECGHKVVAAGSKEEALRVCQAEWPEVALVDIVIPAGTNHYHYKRQSIGLELAKELKAARPELGIVLFSAHEDRLVAFLSLVEQNVRGLAYKLKGCPPWELVEAIREVRSGRVLMDPEVTNATWFANYIAQTLTPEERPYLEKIIQNWDKLTQNQKEVAELLATGLPSNTIADDKLHQGRGTVNNLITEIYKVLELTNGDKEGKNLRRDVILGRAYLIIQLTRSK